MSASEDHELIRKINAGSQEDYAALIRKYQGRIVRLCAAILSDSKEAEDAAQEIFIKVFYTLSKFKENSTFYTWLYRIASNHCLDIVRKKSRRPTLSWDHLLEQRGDEIEKLFLQDEHIQKSKQDKELVDLIFSYLSEDFRLVLTLREIQGLNYKEMAVSLGCSLAAVKSRLKRARHDFQQKLRHFLDSETV